MVSVVGGRLANRGRHLGESLREARVAHHKTLDEIAVKLRIPPKYLKALEEDNLSIFSAEVYAKGVYRKYATYLGVDTKGSWHVFLQSLAVARERVSLKVPMPSTWLQLALRPGRIFVAVVLLLAMGVMGYISLQVRSFVHLPEINLIEPGDFLLQGDDVMVQGVAEADAEVTINGEEVLLNKENQFMLKLPLKPGINVLQVEAKGASGRINTLTKHLLVPRN